MKNKIRQLFGLDRIVAKNKKNQIANVELTNNTELVSGKPINALQNEESWKFTPRVGHGCVYRCVLSSNGRFALTLGTGGSKLWLTKSGDLIRTYRVFSVAEFISGDDYIVAGYKNEIAVVETNTGKFKHSKRISYNKITAISVSPDSNTIASGTEHGEVFVWHLPTSTLKKMDELDYPNSNVADILHLAFSPNGDYLAISTKLDALLVWSWGPIKSDRQKTTILKGVSRSYGGAEALAFSSNEDILRVYENGSLHTYDWKRIREITREKISDISINAITFVKKSDQLIVVCDANNLYEEALIGIREWWQEIKMIPLDSNKLNLLKASVICGVDDLYIKNRLRIGGSVKQVTVDTKESTCLFLGRKSVVVKSLTSDSKPIKFKVCESSVRRIIVSPRGQYIFSLLEDSKRITAWEMITGRHHKTILSESKNYCDFDVSPCGSYLVAITIDGDVSLFDAKSCSKLSCLKKALGSSISYKTGFLADGRVMVSNDCNVIWLYDVSTSNELIDLNKLWVAYAGEIHAKGDVALLVKGTDDWSLVSLEDGSVLKQFNEDKHGICFNTTVKLSPDGRTFLAAGVNEDTGIYDAHTGKAIYKYDIYDCRSGPIEFSSDGTLIAAVSKGKNIEIWSSSSQTCIQKIEKNDVKVTAVTFSPAQDRLVVGYENGMIVVFDLLTANILYEIYDQDSGWLVINSDEQYRAGGEPLAFLVKGVTSRVIDIDYENKRLVK